jgi:hypothetical protein
MFLLFIILLFIFFWFGIRILRRIYVSQRHFFESQHIETAILSLLVGKSFESIAREQQFDQIKADFFEEEDMWRAWQALLAYCKHYPSQALVVLRAFKQALELRQKIKMKAQALSVQAKAQAFVSGGIYMCLLSFQFFNSETRAFFFTQTGRLCTLISLILFFAGTYIIKKRSYPRGVDL